MVEVKEIKKRKTTKLNKSVHFILPMLGLAYNEVKHIVTNSYLRDNTYRSNYINYYIFLQTTDKDDSFKTIPSYVENYNIPEGYMYVFKTPKEFEEDYLKFILGKYSEFSSDYKRKIVTLLPDNYQQTNVFKVIMKSKEAKKLIEDKLGCSIGEQEVMSIPDIKGDESYG